MRDLLMRGINAYSMFSSIIYPSSKIDRRSFYYCEYFSVCATLFWPNKIFRLFPPKVSVPIDIICTKSFAIALRNVCFPPRTISDVNLSTIRGRTVCYKLKTPWIIAQYKIDRLFLYLFMKYWFDLFCNMLIAA